MTDRHSTPTAAPTDRPAHSRLAWFVEALRAELARTGVSGRPEKRPDSDPPPTRASRVWAWRAAER